MRILADENVPIDAVELLRKQGHDVLWIRADSPGIPDETILVRAVTEQRLLITFDKDFGEIVFRKNEAASCGVVLFRISVPSSAAAAKTIATILDSRTDWIGHFSVVDDRRIRMMPLPHDRPRLPR